VTASYCETSCLWDEAPVTAVVALPFQQLIIISNAEPQVSRRNHRLPPVRPMMHLMTGSNTALVRWLPNPSSMISVSPTTMMSRIFLVNAALSPSRRSLSDYRSLLAWRSIRLIWWSQLRISGHVDATFSPTARRVALTSVTHRDDAVDGGPCTQSE